MSKISIIAAIDRRMAIGFQNKLLFWLPNELKRFKALTTGHTILMGRKHLNRSPKAHCPTAATSCCLLIPKPNVKGQKSLLPSKLHCNIAEKKNIYISLEEPAFIARNFSAGRHELCLTEIDDTAPEADAYFPNSSSDEWQEKAEKFIRRMKNISALMLL